MALRLSLLTALIVGVVTSSALGFGGHLGRADLLTDRQVTVTFDHRVVVHGCFSKDGCVVRWSPERRAYVIERVWP